MGKSKKTAPAPKLRARSASRAPESDRSHSTAELALDWRILTARSCYLELKLFSQLSEAVDSAPDLVSAEGVSLVAGNALRAHHDLAAEIIRSGEDPILHMQVFRNQYDSFFERIETRNWHELLLSAYLVSGILGDFTRAVADADDERNRTLLTALHSRADSPVLREIIYQALEEQPKMADRLALWGRRLVGDVLLMCRETFPELISPEGLPSPSLQAVLTEIIAGHTRRMDSLGLTA